MPDMPTFSVHSGHHADGPCGARPPAADSHGDILRFSIAEGRDVVTVSLEGELDLITVADAALALELASTRGAPVTVDCTQLRFADVAAVRFLRRARDRARSSGGDLTLANPQATVRRVLEITDSLFLVAEGGPHGATAPVTYSPAAVLRAAAAAAAQLTGAPRANAQLIDPTAQVMLYAGSAAVASVPVRAPGGALIAVISVNHDAPLAGQDMTRQHLERLAEATGRLI